MRVKPTVAELEQEVRNSHAARQREGWIRSRALVPDVLFWAKFAYRDSSLMTAGEVAVARLRAMSL